MKTTPLLLTALVILGASAPAASADDEMFRPEPTLTPERAGKYTLRVVTPVPSACYVAAGVRSGPPATVRITGDTVPIRVLLKERRGRVCAQMVTQVRHLQRNVKLGGRTGKTKVLVFAMLGGKVVGSNGVDMPALPAPPPPSPPPPSPPAPSGPSVSSADWHAWVNKMPPGPASFHVTGTVTLPHAGYDAKLVAASPQGINPKELILDLVVTARPGVHAQVVTSVPVRFDKKSYAGNYEGVLVREPDGDSQHTTVEEAH